MKHLKQNAVLQRYEPPHIFLERFCQEVFEALIRRLSRLPEAMPRTNPTEACTLAGQSSADALRNSWISTARLAESAVARLGFAIKPTTARAWSLAALTSWWS